MIQHPPEPMYPSRKPSGARRDWREPPALSSPYGRDRDYEPEPNQVPYSRNPDDSRGRYYADDQSHHPEWHQDQQYGRQNYNPPPQFPDWQQSEDWPRGPGYRGRDMNREQTREMDEYYAERYANPEPGYEPRQRPDYRTPPYRNGGGHSQRQGRGVGNPQQQGQPGQYGAAGSWNTGRNAAATPQRPPQPQVNYRGRAPKGYVRSDERIREDICDRLSEERRVDASDISVSVRDGIVTLEGSIADRPQKHRAEDIADTCSGVKDVRNYLSVLRRANGNGGGAGDTPRDAPRKT